MIPERNSVIIYQAIDHRRPEPRLDSWIIVYASWNDPNKYCADVLIYDEESGHGLNYYQAADLSTPYDALQALSQVIEQAKPNEDVSKEMIAKANVAIAHKRIYTPFVPVNDTQMLIMPLPKPAYIYAEVKTILSDDCLVTGGQAAHIAGVSREAISKWREQGKLIPRDEVVFETTRRLYYLVSDVLALSR